MKNGFMRILSLILVLACLLSVFSVFAYADGGETGDLNPDQNTGSNTPGAEEDPFAKVKETYPGFSLLYQRDFEEGWAITNGMSWVDRGSFISVDREMTSDYYYNYFMRFTVGSKENSYLEMKMDTTATVGTVFECDVMSDDYCHIPSLLHFGTLGGASAARENPDAFDVKNGKINFFNNKSVGNRLADGSTTAGLGDVTEEGYTGKIISPAQLEAWSQISDQWLHIAIVFDYTYGDVYDEESGTSSTPEPDPNFDYANPPEKHNTDAGSNGSEADTNPTNYKNYFTMTIYIAPTEEYKRTGELYMVDRRTIRGRVNGGGEGLSLMRIGTSGLGPDSWDTSVCFDNIVVYCGANEYGLATEAMGAGQNVNEKAALEYTVEGGGNTKSDTDYILEGVAYKVGVEYMRKDGERVAIAYDEAGNVIGAPFKDKDGIIYIPLLPTLDAINYRYYLHEDENYVDISTGSSSSYISVGKNTATVDGERITLAVAPGYKDGILYVSIDDFDLLIPDKQVNYDEMGLIVITDRLPDYPNLLNRESHIPTMLKVMKSFVFDYVKPDDVVSDVADHTEKVNGAAFDHPYLLGDEAEFDWLRAVYNAESPEDENYNPDLKNHITKIVSTAYGYYKYYAKPYFILNTKDAVDEDGHKIQDTDENGDPLFDENGDPVYKQEAIYSWAAAYDDNGNSITLYVFDSEGNLIPDENGNMPFVQAKDDNGELMYDEEGDPIMVRAQYIESVDGEGNPVFILDPDYVETTFDSEGHEVKVNYHTIVTVDDFTGKRTPMYLLEYRYMPSYTREHREYIGIFDDGYDYDGDGDAYELIDYFKTTGRNYTNYSLSQPYLDNGAGYDLDGGRSNVSNRTNIVQYIGLAWQITHDVKYLLAAFDIGIALGDLWDHWGPGHFLNCADGSAPYAYMFDMCYDGFVALYNDTGDLDGDGIDDFDIEAARTYNQTMGRDSTYYDVKKIANILYEKGVYEGYISSNDIHTFYQSPIVGTGGSLYRTRENNWNCVCSSGMVIAALALLEFDYEFDFENKGKAASGKIAPEILVGTIQDHAAWLISNNIENLVTYGLDCYAPDGAYNEGPGYWAYGTNNFFEMCQALDTATGGNYGLMDCWAMDTTCYYTCHSESSDFRTFNYHDGSMGTAETQYFFYVAEALNDPALAVIRMNHLKGGKSFQFNELFAYPKNLEETEDAYPALDYFFAGIELYASRSSWDKGALYVGVMGGPNDHTHNQIDAGSFVYHNNGAVWFIDLGTENYNAKGFWGGATRYRYYVMKPEGNNTVTVTTDLDNIPWGQKLSGGAEYYDYGTNEYGSYVKYNLTSAMAPAVNSWHRAVMLTNNRQTTIIQDEIASNGNQSYFWFGHYSSEYVSRVEFSSDNRTAYMYGQTSKTLDDDMILRVSIVSNQTDIKFVDMDTYTFVHNDPERGTYDKEWVNAQGPDENDRSRYRKLAIEGGGKSGLSFTVAVVIELVNKNDVGTDREPPVQYDWTEIKDWGEPAEYYIKVDSEEGLKRPVAARPDFGANVNRAKKMVENGVAFTTDFAIFYRTLTDAYYIYTTLEQQLQAEQYKDTVASYTALRDSFQSFRNAVVSISAGRESIVDKLMGW